MEASAAGLAGDGTGDGQQQQGEQQEGQGPDLATIASGQDDLRSQLEQMRSYMEEQSWQPPEVPAEQDTPPEPADLSFVDPNEPNYDPQRAAGQLLEVLQQQNQQALSEALAPLQNDLQEVRSAREADYLAQEFPDLQNPETADAVFKATAEAVQAAGLPAEAAQNMQMVRLVYLAGRAQELAAGEQSEEQSQQVATLEGAGGASPGGSTGGLTAESIVSAPGGRSPLPFK